MLAFGAGWAYFVGDFPCSKMDCLSLLRKKLLHDIFPIANYAKQMKKRAYIFVI